MRYAVAGTVRHFGLIAAAVVALGGGGAAWAQPGKPCDRAAATMCTDQKVRECQAKGGSQETIGQCQFQENKACYTANNCPTSAR